MRLSHHTDTRARARPAIHFLAFGLLVALGANASVRAQSGRRPTRPDTRASRPTDAPAPVATPAESPAPTAAANARTASAPEFSLVVAGRVEDGQTSEQANVILASFLKRLKDAPNAAAAYAGEMKREQAEGRAKGEREAFVVLVELEMDRVQDGRIILSTPDLVVKYQVFEPTTGRTKMKGKVYFQPAGGARARKERWPDGPPIKMTPEAAGIEAAERVLGWLAANRLEESRKQGGVRMH